MCWYSEFLQCLVQCYSVHTIISTVKINGVFLYQIHVVFATHENLINSRFHWSETTLVFTNNLFCVWLQFIMYYICQNFIGHILEHISLIVSQVNWSPFLWTGIIKPVFQSSGNFTCFHISFTRWHMCSSNTSRPFFCSSAGITSVPWDV